jgi:hypothetical protein
MKNLYPITTVYKVDSLEFLNILEAKKHRQTAMLFDFFKEEMPREITDDESDLLQEFVQILLKSPLYISTVFDSLK